MKIRSVNYTVLVEIVLYQILLLLSIGILLSAFLTAKTGLTFILGGGLSIIPGWLFGRIFFKSGTSGKAKTIVNTFYYGEGFKIILTLALFAIVFQWQDVEAVSLFAGFVATQFAYWVALIKVRA